MVFYSNSRAPHQQPLEPLASLTLDLLKAPSASTALELMGPQPSKAALGRPALLLAASMGKGEGGSDLLPGKPPRPGLWKLGLEIG